MNDTYDVLFTFLLLLRGVYVPWVKRTSDARQTIVWSETDKEVTRSFKFLTSNYANVRLSACLPVCLSACLSLSVSVSLLPLSLYLTHTHAHTHPHPFNLTFSPTPSLSWKIMRIVLNGFALQLLSYQPLTLILEHNIILDFGVCLGTLWLLI